MGTKEKAPDSPAKHASALRDERALEQLLAELPSGAQYVLVQRQNTLDPMKWDHSGKIAAADFSIETVKDYNGGGSYRAQLVGEKGRLLGTKLEFSIDARFKPTKGPLAEAPAAPGTAVVVGEHAGLAALKSQVEMLTLLMLKGSMTPAGPVTDPFQGALKIAELMKANAPAAAVGDSLLQKFLEGMTLGQKLSGGDGDGFAKLAEASSPLFSAIAENIAADATAKRRRQDMKVVKGGAPAATGDWRDRVRPHVPKLLGLAQAKKDPELYAELMLDNIADEVFVELETLAKGAPHAPAFVAQLLMAFPELEPERVWVTEFLTAVWEQLTAPEESTAAQS